MPATETNARRALAIARRTHSTTTTTRRSARRWSASARGRAFLAEYARRNRNADTEVLLAAIDRLEAQLRADAAAAAASARRSAHAADRHPPRPPRYRRRAACRRKAIEAAALLDLLERRIDAMVGGTKPAALSRDRTKRARRARRGAAARRTGIADPFADAQAPAMAAGRRARAVAAVMPERERADSSPPPASRASPPPDTECRPAACAGADHGAERGRALALFT